MKAIQPLTNAYLLAADPSIAAGQKAYMKNLFPFFGIKTEKRREICKVFFKELGILDEATLTAIVTHLWELPQREYQYAAQELLHHHRKTYSASIIDCIEYCVTHKSWWDTVDALSSNCAGPYFTRYPENIHEITGRWNRSDHMWLNRTSLLFQLKYKKNTDRELLSAYIIQLSSSKEFFIRKAIGWILREYAKTDPEWVRKFVNRHPLSNLSKKEALKNINPY